MPGVAVGGSRRLMMAANHFHSVPRRRTMSATKTASKKAAKSAKKATRAKADAKPKRASAIDAAAKVLAGAKEPMACKELIEAMATKGLWKSPGGRTPHATLYSAILREINEKGKDARFKKPERGKFALAG
jgi:hypothetical protein